MLGLLREQDKLERSLGGIKEMGGVPNLMFVIDTNKEAHRNCRSQEAGHPGDGDPRFQQQPDGIAFPIPGNDDAARAIALYCDLAARAVIDGLGQSQTAAGVDRRAAEEIVDTGAVPVEAEPAPLKRYNYAAGTRSLLLGSAVAFRHRWRLTWPTSPLPW